MMLLVKVPEPEPFVVLVIRLTVGLGDVLQTTPRAVTGMVPSSVMLPPTLALVVPILLAAVVAKVGVSW